MAANLDAVKLRIAVDVVGHRVEGGDRDPVVVGGDGAC